MVPLFFSVLRIALDLELRTLFTNDIPEGALSKSVETYALGSLDIFIKANSAFPILRFKIGYHY